jgi:hypothetical protein
MEVDADHDAGKVMSWHDRQKLRHIGVAFFFSPSLKFASIVSAVSRMKNADALAPRGNRSLVDVPVFRPRPPVLRASSITGDRDHFGAIMDARFIHEGLDQGHEAPSRLFALPLAGG